MSDKEMGYKREEMPEILWRWKFAMDPQVLTLKAMFDVQLPGQFNLKNCIAAAFLSELIYREEAFVYQIAEQGWHLYNVKCFRGKDDTNCFTAGIVTLLEIICNRK
jgi:hypothetical protein